MELHNFHAFPALYNITSRATSVLLRGTNDRCLHSLSVFTVRKFIIGLIIQYASLNITRKILLLLLCLNPKSSPRLEPRTVFGSVTSVPVIFSPKHVILLFPPFFDRVYFPSYRNHLHRDSNPEQLCGVTVFVSVISSSKQFGLTDVFQSCLVSMIQKPPSPGFEPRTLFRSFGLSKISSWCHRISKPSLVQIAISVLEL
jgi:hypothetical protein